MKQPAPHVKRSVLVDGAPIGEVGWYRQDGKVWLHWWIHEDYRRAGRATLAMFSFLSETPLPAYALIRPWNIASIALAVSLGGIKIEEDEENVLFSFGGAK